MRLLPSGLALVSLLCTAASAQTVINGSGRILNDFIAAASPGDVFVVEGGPYDPVVADVGVTLITSSIPIGGVTVRDLGPGETFHLSGGFLPDFRAENCQGTVVFGDAIVPGDVEIENCAQVSIESGLFGRITSLASNLNLGRVTSSGQVLLDTGLEVDGGTVTISESTFRGTLDAGPGDLVPAIRLNACEAWMTTTEARAATLFAPSPAVVLDGGATLHVDPQTMSFLFPSAGQPAIQSNGGSNVVVQDIPSLTVSRLVVGDPFGANLDTRLVAAPSQAYAVVLGLPQPALATPFGPWWLGTGTVLAIAAGTTDFNGSFVETSLPIPASLSVGERYVLQAVTFDAVNGVVFGAPRVRVSRPFDLP